MEDRVLIKEAKCPQYLSSTIVGHIAGRHHREKISLSGIAQTEVIFILASAHIFVCTCLPQ